MLRKTMIGTALAALALAAGAAQAHEVSYRHDRFAEAHLALSNAEARRDADLRQLRYDRHIRNFAGVERDRAALAYDRQQIAEARYALEHNARWHRG